MKKILKNKKGFTLMELIIVIAILAILAAILVPTFANVINDAHASAAVADAKNSYTIQMVAALNASIEDGAEVSYDDITGTGESGKHAATVTGDEEGNMTINLTFNGENVEGYPKTTVSNP